jgi:hypothetical protein
MTLGLREKILLAGAIISGITALTTTLRAFGMSRRDTLLQEIEKLGSGSRLGGFRPPPDQGRNRFIQPLVSTVIWFIISVATSIPVMRAAGESANLFLIASPLAILLLSIMILWNKILRRK